MFIGGQFVNDLTVSCKMKLLNCNLLVTNLNNHLCLILLVKYIIQINITAHIHYVLIYYITDTPLHVTSVVLCAVDHAELCKITKSASGEWRSIGGELGFSIDELDSIVREPGRHGDVDYYQAMLRKWLDWAPPNHNDPTLQCLISALRVVGKERLANVLISYKT